MKKFLSLLTILLILCGGICGCTRKKPIDEDTTPKTEGRLEDWAVTVGGKKYQVITDDETAELYSDSKAEKTKDGITFTGSGGFWDKKDGTSGAGCGGVYTIPFDAKDGFSVSFTIDTIGKYDTVHVNNGNWDSWFSFGIVNTPKMFNTKPGLQNNAKGLVGLLIPFAEPSDGHNGSVIMYDCGSNWSYKGDNSLDVKIQDKHTLEMKKSEDEWGVEYSLYFDDVKLGAGGSIMGERFADLFPDGKVYLQFYMQNWNARPKISDLPENKVYPSSSFTVHTITAKGKTTSFL